MDEYSAIVRGIYARALDEHPWEGLLDDIAGLVDVGSAFMFSPFVAEADGGVALTRQMPRALIERYLTEVASVDIWYHELLRRHGGPLSTGLIFDIDTLNISRETARSRLFADYLKPCDIGRCLGTMVSDGAAEEVPQATLCLYRPLHSEPFTAQDRAHLRALQPHLTQAMRVRHRLREARQDIAALAMERVAIPVVVLGRGRRILSANPAAEALFAQCGLPLVASACLRACEPAQTAALDDALKACAACSTVAGKALRLGGPPGHGVVARLVPPPHATPGGSGAAAIAFLAREGHSGLDLRSIMRELYCLTPAEAELAKALSEGSTAEAFAEQRNVGLATVKTQLRAVFDKTGTRRQSELMRLIFSIA